MQTAPPEHTVPHAPQLLRSLSVSTHCPPQLAVPVGQAQTAATHVMGAGHATAQLPQLSGSLATSTQLEPHWSCPGGHPPASHAPAAQTWPAAHTVPHVPQLAPSPCTLTH
jgi:hypothetical protein